MIGERQGGHAHFHGALDHMGYVAETVQQGVLGMYVEMDKRHRCKSATNRSGLGALAYVPELFDTNFC